MVTESRVPSHPWSGPAVGSLIWSGVASSPTSWLSTGLPWPHSLLGTVLASSSDLFPGHYTMWHFRTHPCPWGPHSDMMWAGRGHSGLKGRSLCWETAPIWGQPGPHLRPTGVVSEAHVHSKYSRVQHNYSFLAWELCCSRWMYLNFKLIKVKWNEKFSFSAAWPQLECPTASCAHWVTLL